MNSSMKSTPFKTNFKNFKIEELQSKPALPKDKSTLALMIELFLILETRMMH